MIGVTKRIVASLVITLAVAGGPATAAPTPSQDDEPVCEQGTWAMQGNEKRYVCLSWRFRGQVYAPYELEAVLAPLGRRVPDAVAPPPSQEERTIGKQEPQRREAEQRNTDQPVATPPAVTPSPEKAYPQKKRRARDRDDDDDDDDDC
jgi:hypothetical protein